MSDGPVKATPQEVAEALGRLRDWSQAGDELRIRYLLPSFPAAVQFTADIAPVAEQINHHPEWRVAYRHVSILTTTHDAGGLSALDFELAARISELAAAAGAVRVDGE